MSRRDHVGVFTTDVDLVVQSWDTWMADATGLSESAACGEPLTRLVPDIAQRGLLSRLRRVADGAGVEVLAPAFHKYLIPCPPRDPTSRFERMRQHVTIAPLRDRDGIAGLIVTIEDVTARFDRDLQLSVDLDSHDEAVRLRAAETLAAGGAAPSLLAGALTDDSWRVRRVAAEGMAASGGRAAVDNLLEALREHHRDLGLLNATLTALTKTHADVVTTLTALLTDGDTDVRTYAALALGLIGDRRAGRALIDRLGDVDVNVRFHAIEALGRLGETDAVGALVEIAASRDFFLSFAALDALATIADSSVVPELLELLDEDSLITAVVGCLGAVASEEAVAPIAELLRRPGAPIGCIATALTSIHDRVQRQISEGALVADLARGVLGGQDAAMIIDALTRANADELRGLLVLLSWLPNEQVDATLASFLAHPAVGKTAAELLAGRGATAAVHVERAAAVEGAEIKQLAAGVLGRIGTRSSVPTLIGWLGSERDVIVAAAAALGAIGDARAFEPLLKLLDDPDAPVRQAAVAALNSIGHPRMEEAIAGRLKSDSPRVREAAARIAGYFGYGSCLRQLVELCDDAEELVRRAVVEHLANFDERQAWSKIRELLVSDPSAIVRAAAVRALSQSASDGTLSLLLGATRDPSLWVRYYAIRVMANRTPAHADALARLAECAMRDPAPPVRIAAIEALAVAGSPSVVRVLEALVHDRELEVACAAVTALGSFECPGDGDVLRAALDDPEPRMQHSALDAFAKRGAGPASEISRLARFTRDPTLRDHAVHALGHLSGAGSVAALLELAADRRLQESVTIALARIGASDAETLAARLSDSEELARRVIVEALARVKEPASTAALARALGDSSPNVRIAAARALSRFDLHDARRQLTALARTDENAAVRTAARDALASG